MVTMIVLLILIMMIDELPTTLLFCILYFYLPLTASQESPRLSAYVKHFDFDD